MPGIVGSGFASVILTVLASTTSTLAKVNWSDFAAGAGGSL